MLADELARAGLGGEVDDTMELPCAGRYSMTASRPESAVGLPESAGRWKPHGLRLNVAKVNSPYSILSPHYGMTLRRVGGVADGSD